MVVENIQSDLKQAQLARDEIVVSTLRMLLAEIHNTQIQKGQDLSDQDVITVLQRETKKRKEAAAGFRLGGREESAQKEEAELKVLQKYLPAEMPHEELTKIVESTINEMGATTISDMGKVMSAVMERVKGQADGGTVSSLVKEKLSK